ncbi:hypothetical protein ACFE04_013263 [Oxalis oulophora]
MEQLKITVVSSTDLPEFTHLTRTLNRSSIVAIDAEWKPIIRGGPDRPNTFPTVSLLQLACQLSDSDESEVFLVDLYTIPLSSIWVLLKDVFCSPNVLKLGFGFKQDLVYLSSTFVAQGCGGFDKVEPYLDIKSIYNRLQHKPLGRKASKETKSLATICREVLGISLSKELQCSDWSHRPLTEDQKIYAAKDAVCLLEIFSVFQTKVIKEVEDTALKITHANSVPWTSIAYTWHVILRGLAFDKSWVSFSGKRSEHPKFHPSIVKHGLKGILEEPNHAFNIIIRHRFTEASDLIRGTTFSEYPQMQKMKKSASDILMIVRKYGEKIELKECDKKPTTSKKKRKKRPSMVTISRQKQVDTFDQWLGLPPWDVSLGEDGCPKFLCDVMVEGLAKHLRCVGIDAAVPHSKKPESRELIEQAYKEKRVLLTRDAKLLRHDYLPRSQIYRVESLLKNEQLLEVIKTFQLTISEDKLMSRCTKCNGRFIQKPLSTEEAVEAAKGFQKIPSCLFDKNLEFWRCMDCNQLYWEGTQYHNAVQKFIDVCKLND